MPALLRKRPPSRSALLVEAISLGVDTTERLADLFGVPRQVVRSTLGDLETRMLVSRSGYVRKPGRRGAPLRRWSVSQ